jgi:hypothetical protein
MSSSARFSAAVSDALEQAEMSRANAATTMIDLRVGLLIMV